MSGDKKIRIVNVDDSAFMIKALEMMLKGVDDIEIVGIAKNGKEAIDKVKQLKPDVITLDIEMPVMDGISALKVLMKESPLPVIMLSSLTTDGAESTMEALSIGAADFIAKQSSFVSLDIIKIKEELVSKIRYFAKNKFSVLQNLVRQKVAQRKNSIPVKKTVPKKTINENTLIGGSANPILTSEPVIKIKNNTEIVVIGSSTGGPAALQKVIPKLPKNFPLPVLIVQHMPPAFTKSLASRLDNLSNVSVCEAKDGEKMEAGKVYIAPGDRHMITKNKTNISMSNLYPEALHKPSVNVLMDSVNDIFGKRTVAVIMTGMGQDGTLALEKLDKSGAYIIGQNEESCVVYGMPKIPNQKYSKVIVDVEDIADSIVKAL